MFVRETGRFELPTCSLSSNLGSTEKLKPIGGLEEGEGDDDAAPMLQEGRSAGIIEQKARAVGTEMQIEEAERERDKITRRVTRRL